MAGRTTFELSTAASNMAASQLFYFLLVPLLVLWLIYFKLSRRNLNKHAENIPGPPGLPIVGNLFDLMGSSHSKWTFFGVVACSFFFRFRFAICFHNIKNIYASAQLCLFNCVKSFFEWSINGKSSAQQWTWARIVCTLLGIQNVR